MMFTYDFVVDALRQAEAQLQAAATLDTSISATNILTLWQEAKRELDDLQEVSN